MPTDHGLRRPETAERIPWRYSRPDRWSPATVGVGTHLLSLAYADGRACQSSRHDDIPASPPGNRNRRSATADIPGHRGDQPGRRVMLMSAAPRSWGSAPIPAASEHRDLDEARRLIHLRWLAW